MGTKVVSSELLQDYFQLVRLAMRNMITKVSFHFCGTLPDDGLLKKTGSLIMW